jgi:hypothetical protein
MRYQVTTKLSPQEAITRAKSHFGPGGTGLDIVSEDDACVTFEGRGGYVSVVACPGDKVRVELEVREWDYAARQFMNQIG